MSVANYPVGQVFDSREQAEAEAKRRYEAVSAPKHDDVTFVLNHEVTPEPDEHGLHTGRWRVTTVAAWKAWISGRQYGDVVALAYIENLHEAWASLLNQYNHVRSRVLET